MARLSYWNQSLITPDIGFPRVCSVFIPFLSDECTRHVPCLHDAYLRAAGGLLLDSPFMISSSIFFLPVQGAVRVPATNPRYGVSSGIDKRRDTPWVMPLHSASRPLSDWKVFTPAPHRGFERDTARPHCHGHLTSYITS